MSEIGIQKTNDDAQVSKLSCVRLGYFKDDFIHLFVKSPQRRAPLINRGYFSRYYILRSLLLNFIALHTKSKQKHQVIVLGAGYDTTFFQLYKEGVLPTNLLTYVELDFIDITRNKALALQHSNELRSLFIRTEETHDSSSGNTTTTTTTTTTNNTTTNTNTNISIMTDTTHGTASLPPFFHILPADLRDTTQVHHALLTTAGIDPSIPTFILAECVLTYMTSTEGTTLLSWLSSTFSTSSAIAIYDPINPHDPFGQQMMVNTRHRGCPLIGIQSSLHAWEERLTQVAGWKRADVKSMRELYRCGIDVEERRKIERLEIFDEFEEWDLIQDHYCIALGVNTTSDESIGVLLDQYRLP